ncbi:response regulator transcription factor [Thiopseudomonas alkaliphila]|uniref:response regulator transcription factor n=1 Tax=Thiopseudomonas alkaliphila TaxID=1697053 RepID=UPI00069D5717|nr:response regulator transcription factor [Thiopseudomonas alkaliphila]AKX57678.1 hypothetical protein AKN89_07525 [Thiopseudomonas alkaliphila]
MKKIVFIDEDRNMLNTFKSHINMSSFKSEFEVVTFYPLESLEKTIEKIHENKPDAIISDYELNDKKDFVNGVNYSVPYNGADLIKSFLNERPGFPCFILTSYDDDAMLHTDDINRVYIKNVLNENTESNHVSFLGRVLKQIANYKNLQKQRQDRLKELVEKSQRSTLNDKEEEELINLDTLVEQANSMSSAVPKELKKSTNNEKLSELLHTAEKLLSLLNIQDHE